MAQFNVLPAPQKDKKEAGWIMELRGWTFHRGGLVFVGDTLVENLARRGLPDFKPDKPEEALPDKGPVINRISHVVLLPSPDYSDRARTNDTMNFEKINKNVGEKLIKDAIAAIPRVAAPAGAQGTPAPAPVQPTNTGRDQWTPVGTASHGAVPDRGAAATTPGTTPKGGEMMRTEFVIVFIWREPTPSDELRGLKDAAKSTAPRPAFRPVKNAGCIGLHALVGRILNPSVGHPGRIENPSYEKSDNEPAPALVNDLKSGSLGLELFPS